MIIHVGSENRTKVEAVRELTQQYPLLVGAEVIGMRTISGVSEQPMSLEETVRGAINRARNVFQDCNYSFGIESGLVAVPQTKTRYMDLTVCAIYDGTQPHLGISSAFEYPIKIVEMIVAKRIDVSQAYRQAGLTKENKIGEQEGVIGLLTKGRLGRKEYTKEAIRMALIHLENPELYIK